MERLFREAQGTEPEGSTAAAAAAAAAAATTTTTPPKAKQQRGDKSYSEAEV